MKENLQIIFLNLYYYTTLFNKRANDKLTKKRRSALLPRLVSDNVAFVQLKS